MRRENGVEKHIAQGAAAVLIILAQASSSPLTWLLETPLMASALSRSSTERVEMPGM
jgi:hypothetical protein